MGVSTPRSSWPCLAAFSPHFAYDDDFINTETPKQKIEVAQYHEPTAPPAGIQPKMAECGQNKGTHSGVQGCTIAPFGMPQGRCWQGCPSLASRSLQPCRERQQPDTQARQHSQNS